MTYTESPSAGITEIYDLLYRLGLTANYTGFFYTSYAVWLAAERPDRLLMVTKWLYSSVAKQYHTTWTAVKLGIRLAVNIVWDANPDALREMAGFHLTAKPTPAKFLAIVSGYYAVHRAA